MSFVDKDWPTPSESVHVKNFKSKQRLKKHAKYDNSNGSQKVIQEKKIENSKRTSLSSFIMPFNNTDSVYDYELPAYDYDIQAKKECAASVCNLNSIYMVINNMYNNPYIQEVIYPMHLTYEADKNNVDAAPIRVTEDPILMVKANVLSYYFSETNLCHDKYLISLMDDDGWMNIEELLKFPRLKKINTSKEDIFEIINYLSYPKFKIDGDTNEGVACLELSNNTTKIRRSDMTEFNKINDLLSLDSFVPVTYEAPFPKYTYDSFITNSVDRANTGISDEPKVDSRSKQRGSRKSENIKNECTDDQDVVQDNLDFEFSSKPNLNSKNAFGGKFKRNMRKSKERSRSRHTSGESEDELDEGNIYILSLNPNENKIDAKMNWADISDSDDGDDREEMNPQPVKNITGISQRLLNKHPSGDRHPNPDYLPRSKIQEQIREIIYDGLNEWQLSNAETFSRCRKDSSSSTSSDIKLTICQDIDKFKLIKQSLTNNKESSENLSGPNPPNNEIHIESKMNIMNKSVTVLKFKPLESYYENKDILFESSTSSLGNPIQYDAWNFPINTAELDALLEKAMCNVKYEDFTASNDIKETEIKKIAPTDLGEPKITSKITSVKIERKKPCKVGFYPVTKVGPSKNQTKDKTRASTNPIEECDVGYAYGGKFYKRLRTQSGSSYIQYNDAGYALAHGMPIPFKDHPSQLLLNDNGFKIKLYNVFRKESLADREKKGIGRSQEMNTLFRFWSFFVRENKNKNMYEEFQKFAWEDATKGYRYGLECLFRMYTYRLEQKRYFNEEMFQDFQKHVLKDVKSNHLYGLEKFWAFLKYSNYSNNENINPEIKKYLDKYKTLDDFRVNFIPPQGFHSYKIENPENKGVESGIESA